jgi:hypothetical protein
MTFGPCTPGGQIGSPFYESRSERLPPRDRITTFTFMVISFTIL